MRRRRGVLASLPLVEFDETSFPDGGGDDLEFFDGFGYFSGRRTKEEFLDSVREEVSDVKFDMGSSKRYNIFDI
jgi:hypothetical protein